MRALATDIGERNAFRLPALRRAADLVAGEWTAQGYRVTPQIYDLGGVPMANLEIVLRGRVRPHEIVLMNRDRKSVV